MPKPIKGKIMIINVEKAVKTESFTSLVELLGMLRQSNWSKTFEEFSFFEGLIGNESLDLKKLAEQIDLFLDSIHEDAIGDEEEVDEAEEKYYFAERHHLLEILDLASRQLARYESQIDFLSTFDKLDWVEGREEDVLYEKYKKIHNSFYAIADWVIEEHGELRDSVRIAIYDNLLITAGLSLGPEDLKLWHRARRTIENNKTEMEG